MAVVSHKTGEYEKAATQYAAASLVNMQQPELFFYASDCYLRLNDPYSAAGSLETCLHICGDDPKWHELKKSAVFTLETIEKGLKDLPAGEKIEPNYRKGGLNDYIRRNPELGDYAEKFFDNDLKFEG